jgi:chemotaxis family two-component system sensor kinase Cph1
MNQTFSEISPPWAGGPYSIKRHGVTITNCDMEPIHTPGCIQSHGTLLVLRPADMIILQASENTEAWLGQPPGRLLGAPVAAVIGQERQARLQETLERQPIEHNPLYVFTLPAQNGVDSLDVVVHTADGLVIIEFEASSRGENSSEPDYYALLKKTITRLQTASNLSDLCQKVTEEVRTLTGLDRVMVYRFHADDHGEVFAESKRADLSPWLGLHYPADDIPKPARTIFKKIWIRPLPDSQAPLVELVPLTNPDNGRPLDMTYCALRGASIMYTEYLQNLGVSASLTMPIHRDGKLWGLIACHHDTPKSFPYQIRAACEFLAQVVSLQIKPVEEHEHLVYRLKLEGVHSQLIAVAAEAGELAIMIDGHPSLLDGMDASGAALYHRDRWWRVGCTPEEVQLEALAAWLSTRAELDSPTKPVYVTDALARDYPEGAALTEIASGLLAVSLSHGHRNMMLWFRPETIQTVNWAGSPHDKPTVPGPHGPRLTPRVSFELFAESVRGRSLPWMEVEIEAVLRLRLLVMELVVSRAERLASLNADLTRINEELDTFAYVASHDLKEPLRGIAKYAHQLLESATTLDEDNRKRLEGLMRLTLRMDNLLDSLLHFSRVGRTALVFEAVDLNEVVAEALEMVAARRSAFQSDIVIPRPLPTVQCDRVRVREIFCNLISNALKYNDKPRHLVEIGYMAPGEPGELQHTPEGCAGQIILYVRDNGIGIEQRHHQQVFKIFKRLHGRDDFGGGTGAGLSIVQILVDRHHGRVWLDSKTGEGTTFYFSLGA